MESIGQRIEQREQEITEMKEKFEQQERGEVDILAGLDSEAKKILKEIESQPIESKVRHLLDEETERENDEMIERVMADISEFKQIADKQDEEKAKSAEERAALAENVQLIEKILHEQSKFSQMVSEFMQKDAEENKSGAA